MGQEESFFIVPITHNVPVLSHEHPATQKTWYHFQTDIHPAS